VLLSRSHRDRQRRDNGKDEIHPAISPEESTAVSVDSQQFQNELEKARAYARSVCAEKGEGSSECAAAWDAVEEMQAEVSHQHQAPKKATSTNMSKTTPMPQKPGSMKTKTQKT
jgi:hypothetical protein